MKTKLLLTIDQSVIKRAKSYAKQTGRSLSEVVENYLISITQVNIVGGVNSKLKKIVGIVSLPQDYEKESERRSNAEAKHLK